jgi:hypothetical protein
MESTRIALPPIPLNGKYVYKLKISNIGRGDLEVFVPNRLGGSSQKEKHIIPRSEEEPKPTSKEVLIIIPAENLSPGETYSSSLTITTNSRIERLKNITVDFVYTIAPPSPVPSLRPSITKKPKPALIRQPAPTKTGPTIKVSKINFGQMKPKERKTLQLKIENLGQQTLVIEKIVVHDRWIRLNVPRDKQNKQAFSGIDVTVDLRKNKAKKGGRVSGKITILSNDLEHPILDVPVGFQVTE